MPGRFVRTTTAERVSELLGSREGRHHLAAHGWEEGMPVLIAAPAEPLNDVMGLVSLHGQSVLVAMIDPELDELKFIRVSTPNPALRTVTAEKDRTRILELFARTDKEGLVTFRAKYWQASAVTYPIPSFYPATESRTYASRVSV